MTRYGEVSGTITWLRNSNPSSCARVTLVQCDGGYYRTLGTADTDQDGRYRIEYQWESSTNPALNIHVNIYGTAGALTSVFPDPYYVDYFGNPPGTRYNHPVETPLELSISVLTPKERSAPWVVDRGVRYGVITGMITWKHSAFPASDIVVEWWDDENHVSSSLGTQQDGRYKVGTWVKREFPTHLVAYLDKPCGGTLLVKESEKITFDVKPDKSYERDFIIRSPYLEPCSHSLSGQVIVDRDDPYTGTAVWLETPDQQRYRLLGHQKIELSRLEHSILEVEGEQRSFLGSAFSVSQYSSVRLFSVPQILPSVVGEILVKNANWVAGSDVPTTFVSGDFYLTDGIEELRFLQMSDEILLANISPNSTRGPKIWMKGMISAGVIQRMDIRLILRYYPDEYMGFPEEDRVTGQVVLTHGGASGPIVSVRTDEDLGCQVMGSLKEEISRLQSSVIQVRGTYLERKPNGAVMNVTSYTILDLGGGLLPITPITGYLAVRDGVWVREGDASTRLTAGELVLTGFELPIRKTQVRGELGRAFKSPDEQLRIHLTAKVLNGEISDILSYSILGVESPHSECPRRVYLVGSTALDAVLASGAVVEMDESLGYPITEDQAHSNFLEHLQDIHAVVLITVKGKVSVVHGSPVTGPLVYITTEDGVGYRIEGHLRDQIQKLATGIIEVTGRGSSTNAGDTAILAECYTILEIGGRRPLVGDLTIRNAVYVTNEDGLQVLSGDLYLINTELVLDVSTPTRNHLLKEIKYPNSGAKMWIYGEVTGGVIKMLRYGILCSPEDM